MSITGDARVCSHTGFRKASLRARGRRGGHHFATARARRPRARARTRDDDTRRRRRRPRRDERSGVPREARSLQESGRSAQRRGQGQGGGAARVRGASRSMMRGCVDLARGWMMRNESKARACARAREGDTAREGVSFGGDVFVSSNARGARGVEAWTRARAEAMTITTSADATKCRTARCAHWRRGRTGVEGTGGDARGRARTRTVD